MHGHRGRLAGVRFFRPQQSGPRQIVQVPQSKDLQKSLRRGVPIRPSQLVGPAGGSHEVTFHQLS